MDPEDDEEADGEDLPPIRLHYPLTYVQRTWREHKDNGVFPSPGGRNRQSAALMDDWAELDRRYYRIYDELKPLADAERGSNTKRGRQSDDFDFGDLGGDPVGAPDVDQLFTD